jgi:hypothetical protein
MPRKQRPRKSENPVYLETFDKDPGGWWGWISNAGGPKALEWQKGQVTSRSPWWIDYNHAPPGGGYLHMVFCTYTRGPQGEVFNEVGGPNRLMVTPKEPDRFPLDYRDAKLTVRLKGEVVNTNGAELILLVQGTADQLTSAWVLTGSPFKITKDWSEQTVTLANDPRKWTCLGSRHDRGDMYGYRPLEQILSDVNIDIMLIFFPLKVIPMGPRKFSGNEMHKLRPEKDYPVWRSKLPEGYVTIDTIKIEFAGAR